MADWAITSYWGVGAPPDLINGRWEGSDRVAGARVGFVGDGLWQLDVLLRNGAFVLDRGEVPFLFGAAGLYDELWVAGEDVFRPAWNYLVPGDPVAARMLSAVEVELAGPGAVLLERAGGQPILCLPDPVLTAQALATFEASECFDGQGVEARVAEALATAGGHPSESGAVEAGFVAGLWTERFGYVGVADVLVEIRVWDWTVTRMLSGQRNVLRGGQSDGRGHQGWRRGPVDAPRIRWPFTNPRTRRR